MFEIVILASSATSSGTATFIALRVRVLVLVLIVGVVRIRRAGLVVVIERILEVPTEYALIVVLFESEEIWVKIFLVLHLQIYFPLFAWTLFGVFFSVGGEAGWYHDVLVASRRRALELLGLVLESVRQ